MKFSKYLTHHISKFHWRTFTEKYPAQIGPTVRCQKTSSGPTCRYYIAILKSSLRDTFLPKIWGKKCPKFGGKNVQGHIGTKFYYIETKSWARVISICRFVINLFLFFHAMAMKNITFRQKVETFFSHLKL